MIKAKDENDVDTAIDVLTSLRVTALSISSELRRSLALELVKNDMFLIEKNQSTIFVTDLLEIKSHSLKHALLALTSIMASTSRGVDYLT